MTTDIPRLLVILFFLSTAVPIASAQEVDTPKLLVRVDDIGTTHASNMAARQIAEAEIPFSVSVMFAAPWHQEMVEILQDHPHVSVGVHLTLNSEWKEFRWGPVLGPEAVPTLVDDHGYFPHSASTLLASDFDLDEVERELSAQIERALSYELEIDYVNPHMGTAVASPELRDVFERVAARYDLAIPTYFGEHTQNMWGVPVDEKQQVFAAHLDQLRTDNPNLIIIHAAKDTPEMRLVDMNSDLGNAPDGSPIVHRHRQAELDMLLSAELLQREEARDFILITYRELIRDKGRAAQTRPDE